MSWIGMIVLDLFSNGKYEVVDRTCDGKCFISPDAIEQHVSGNDLAFVQQEETENIKLFARELQQRFILPDFAPRDVDEHIAKRVGICFKLKLWRSTKHRFDAREKFGKAEWLRHVIVCAD